MDTGVARKPIEDMDKYRETLRSRLDPVAGVLQRVYERLRRRPQRVVFAEGEEEQVIRAAASFVHQGLGTALFWSVARTASARAPPASASSSAKASRSSMPRSPSATRPMPTISTSGCSAKGFLLRDCQRLINQDRNHFAACMVALGDADAMVTGVTRNFSVALEDVRRVIDPKPGHRVIGVSLVLARGRTVLVADTAVTEMPKAEILADIAVEAAGVARRLGYEPRLALLAFSTFGHPPGERAAHVQGAVRILDQRRVDFEYDGDMAADVALNMELRAGLSVLPAIGAGQRADHAGVPFRLDLDQAAAGARRRDRDRPDPGRARPAGADRAALGQRHPARQHGGAGGVQCERLS